MAEAQHPVYDPLTSDGPRKKNKGFTIGLIIAFVFHAALGLYLWKVKFNPHYKSYSDEKVKVDIIHPVAPPPPPPPPAPPPKNMTPPPPPPKIVPHVAPAPPVNIPAPPPLFVPPPPPVVAPPAPPAPPPPPHVAVITNPDWLRRPSAEDVARYYPTRAQNLSKEGRATIRCTTPFWPWSA